MASRGRSLARSPRSGAAKSPSAGGPSKGAGGLLYTAQDVARYCEVDLKTIHHWADAGKIPHHRTEGRHLRFRHRHLVEFLRAHGYPLHDELQSARPRLFYALGEDAPAPAAPVTEVAEEGSRPGAPSHDDTVKKLAGRFEVRRFPDAILAIAHLVSDEPDVVVLRDDDPSWSGAASFAALKQSAATAFPVIVIVDGSAPESGPAPAADLVVRATDLGRLHLELARALGLGG